MQGAEALGFLLRGDDLRLDFGCGLRVPLLGPELLDDQMVLEPLDRIAQRPRFGFLFGPVG